MIFLTSRRFLSTLMCVVMALGLMGCDNNTSNQNTPGRVAIIDITHLAQVTGHDQRISQALQQAQSREQAQLQSLQTQLALDKLPSASASDEEKTKFVQAQQQMRTAIEQAQQRLDALRFSELEKFRNIVRPIAERIAASKGMSIVIERQDSMLSVDPACDITDEVVTEMPTLAGTAVPSSILPPSLSQPGAPGTSMPGIRPPMAPPSTTRPGAAASDPASQSAPAVPSTSRGASTQP